MKKIMVVLIALLTFSGYVFAESDDIFVKSFIVTNECQVILDEVIDAYEMNIEHLEKENEKLQKKLNDVKLNEFLKIIEENKKNNKSILVPDAKYIGEGRYCYPLDTKVIGEYEWKCEEGK